MNRRRIAPAIRDNLITGILVLAPIGAVLWIIIWLWNFLFGLAGVIPNSLNPIVFLNIQNSMAIRGIQFLMTLLLLVVILALIWVVGMLSRNYLGKRLLKAIRLTFIKLPVLNTVYSTLEQLLATFATGKSKNFRRVVRLEYPRKGMYSLALVTAEREKGMLSIYVPTTPNPTSGFYLMVHESDVEDVDMSVEAAFKEILSLGLVRSEGR